MTLSNYIDSAILDGIDVCILLLNYCMMMVANDEVTNDDCG
jgi:hypothetical protein